MSSKDRREREREELKTRIMDAARKLFVEEGYEAVSMRRIADAIEYSPTAIYLHFADKRTLFNELCCSDFARLADVFSKLASIADPVERIRHSGLQYIRFAVQNPHHYRLMFMTPIDYTDAERDTLTREPSRGDPNQDAYAFLHHAVVEAIQQKRFRPDLTDPQLVTQTLWASVHGVASLAVTHHKDPWIEWAPLELRAQTMCDAVLRGLLRAPAKEKRA